MVVFQIITIEEVIGHVYVCIHSLYFFFLSSDQDNGQCWVGVQCLLSQCLVLGGKRTQKEMEVMSGWCEVTGYYRQTRLLLFLLRSILSPSRRKEHLLFLHSLLILCTIRYFCYEHFGHA